MRCVLRPAPRSWPSSRPTWSPGSCWLGRQPGSDGTISSDVLHVEQVRAWFARPLWEIEPPDADAYFGKVLRGSANGTRLARAQALKTYFLFLELRHKVEILNLAGSSSAL